MIHTLAIANYRSLRELVVPLGQLTVVTGANGSGKSSLYRALRLLADVAQDRAIASLAREGGIQSALWAGPESIGRSVRGGEHAVQGTRRSGPVRLLLGFAGDPFGYLIDLGLPIPSTSAFAFDPEIKLECVWSGPSARPAALLAERRGALLRLRNDKTWQSVDTTLASCDSMITHSADPQAAPELLRLREELRGWRFYDQLRCDADAPARHSRVATRTPVLADDGADLAAALRTIIEIGDRDALAAAIEAAFPGSRLEVHFEAGQLAVQLQQQGLLRSLGTAELSDGTLRYLLLIAALLTPRPPPLMVLNEPETSMHPDLLPALGELIAAAAANIQIIVVTHARRLAAAIEQAADCVTLELEKDFGQTRLAGQGMFDRPQWLWPAR